MTERIVGGAAALAGHTLRLLLIFANALPSLAAPALVVWGVAQFSLPAGAIVGGLLLFWLDRQRSRTEK